MYRIIQLIMVAILLSLCGSGTLYAQGWQDRVRKEGESYLRQALGGSEQNKQKATTKKKTATQQPAKRTPQKRSTQPKHEREPQVVRFATNEQIATVRQFTGPVISYIGKEPGAYMGGDLDGSWTYPAHTKSESEQNRWNDQRMDRHEGDETLSNARLAREIAASKKWLEEQEKQGGPIREFMSTLPVRLDEELYNRANVINEYVEYMDELSKAQPDEEREAD